MSARPVWRTAVNGWISPVLLRDGCLLWPNGKPCDDLQWIEPALDAAKWAGEWRNCGGGIVDVLPWGLAEAFRAHRDLLAAAARGLEAQRDSERRHADELVQRISDVTDALGEHRNPGRSLAENVRALVAECERLRQAQGHPFGRRPQPGDVLDPADFGNGEAGVLRLAALLAEAPVGAVVRDNGDVEWTRERGEGRLEWVAMVDVGEVATDPLDIAERAPLAVVAWPGGES